MGESTSPMEGAGTNNSAPTLSTQNGDSVEQPDCAPAKDSDASPASSSAKRKADETADETTTDQSSKKPRLDDLTDIDPFQGDFVAEIQEYLTSREDDEGPGKESSQKENAPVTLDGPGDADAQLTLKDVTVQSAQTTAINVQLSNEDAVQNGLADSQASDELFVREKPVNGSARKNKSVSETDGPEPTTTDETSRKSREEKVDTSEDESHGEDDQEQAEKEEKKEEEEEEEEKPTEQRSSKSKSSKKVEKPTSNSFKQTRSSRSRSIPAASTRTMRANSRAQTRSRTKKPAESKPAAPAQKTRRSKARKPKAEEEVYEVERILKHRDSRRGATKKPSRYYLVHWKGYPEEEATWEPARFLSNAKEVLDEYLGSVEKTGGGSGKTKKSTASKARRSTRK
ncbi:hypothetical protein KEM56_004629 [Ascosphaera pollenicola]|nr:hypothetical protein KEM56_004629 [Ascosphaera pollenicola]